MSGILAGMDDLVEFLRARLEEDEAIARKACEYAEASWKLDEELGETVLWWPPEPRVAEMERQKGLPVVSDQWRGQTIGSRIAPHVARHDPARVLREVTAKRAIVDDLANEIHWGARSSLDYQDAVDAFKRMLKRLALPYVDHRDYRKEWRP